MSNHHRYCIRFICTLGLFACACSDRKFKLILMSNMNLHIWVSHQFEMQFQRIATVRAIQKYLRFIFILALAWRWRAMERSIWDCLFGMDVSVCVCVCVRFVFSLHFSLCWMLKHAVPPRLFHFFRSFISAQKCSPIHIGSNCLLASYM